MALAVRCVIFVFIILAIRNSLGETERYLVSNAETGERKIREENLEESAQLKRRSDGFIYGMSNNDIHDIMKTHNLLRNVTHPTATNMRQMRWSPVLAENAQTYACGCNSYHSSRDSRTLAELSEDSGIGVAGENIWVGTRHGGFAGEVWSWYNEEPVYNYWTGVCESGPCGHYTQGAWHNTYLVGCGFAQCAEAEGFYPGKKAYILVCQYHHKGNYVGAKPYEEGEPCTNCPGGYQGGCQDSLCLPDEPCGGETCQNGGVFHDDGTCVCDCPEGYEGAFCELTAKQEC